MKIVDYYLLASSRNVPLEELVSNRIQQGWQPYGSPYLDRNGVEKQAVVMYEDPIYPEACTPLGKLTPEKAKFELQTDKPKAKPKKKDAKNED